MASLADLLPKPKNAPKSTQNRPNQPPSSVQRQQQQQQQQPLLLGRNRKEQQQQQEATSTPPPPYGQRTGWIPKYPSDFGDDGGAYPEVHMSQYPLNMGKQQQQQQQQQQKALATTTTNTPTTTTTTTTTTTLATVNQQIARQGQRRDKVIYANYTDLIEHQVDPHSLAKPTSDDLVSNIEDTKMALERILNQKIAMTHNKGQANSANTSSHDHDDPTQQQTTLFKYTPSSSASSSSQSRIISVSEVQVDPMEPARFAIKKAPRGPPSPPVPIMHSPDKKVSREVLDEWKIGPCISNWKNPKGYTIPLHQRLAATGKDLNTVQINDRFAQFAESLYIAEREARKEIEQRAEMQKTIMMRQQEAKEEKLRQLAQRARTARFGGSTNAANFDAAGVDSVSATSATSASAVSGAAAVDASAARAAATKRLAQVDTESDSDDDDNGDSHRRRPSSSIEMDEEERKRNRLREERLKEQRYEQRKNKRRPGQVDGEEREISERIALGQMAAISQSFGGELDSRLINQASGLDSGFMADDSYNIYDRSFNRGSSANQIYRPTREAMEAYGGGMNDLEANLEGEGSRFTKSFRGREGETARSSGSGPVLFERERTEDMGDDYHHHRRSSQAPQKSESRQSSSHGIEEDDDMFGLGKFMADAKEGGRKRGLDHIGKSGYMKATGGSSSVDPEQYRDKSSKRRKIDFQSGAK